MDAPIQCPSCRRLVRLVLFVTLTITFTLASASASTPSGHVIPTNGIFFISNLTLDEAWGQVAAYDLSIDRRTLYMLLLNATDIDHEQGTLVAVNVNVNPMVVLHYKSFMYPPQDSPVIDGFGFYVLNTTHAVYAYSNEPEPVTVSLVDLRTLEVVKTMFRMGVAEYLPAASRELQLLWFTPELGYNFGRLFDVSGWTLTGMNSSMPGIDMTMGFNFFTALRLETEDRFIIPTTRSDFVSMPVTGLKQWIVDLRVHDDLLDICSLPYVAVYEDDKSGAGGGANANALDVGFNPTSLFFTYADDDNSTNAGMVWYDPRTLKRINTVQLGRISDEATAAAGGGWGWAVDTDFHGMTLYALPLSSHTTASDLRWVHLGSDAAGRFVLGLQSGNLLVIQQGESASFGHQRASMAQYGVR